MAAIVVLYAIIVFSAVLHEFSHGWVANYLGDPTAKYLGRLTLNPVKHMELYGTVLIPLLLLISGGFFIGWAKPVPYNPYNLRDQKYGSAKVGLAGPAANFVIALIFGLILRYGIVSSGVGQLFFLIVVINVWLGLFNLIPVPPLDGSKLLMDLVPSLGYSFSRNPFVSVFGIIIALVVAITVLGPVSQFIVKLIVGPGLA